MTTDNGGPAFPATHFDLAEHEHGMSLRDYFAAKAMQAYASDEAWRIDMSNHETARAAYNMADAMLKAREPK